MASSSTTKNTPLRVVCFGLGPIGLATAALAMQKKRLQVVGATDIDSDKNGVDLHDLLEQSSRSGIRVEPDAEALLKRTKPDAILHCTSSFLPIVKDQLTLAARLGINVVSSTEELLLAETQHPDLTHEIHEAALAGGATIVGTGVNPGYVMDFLAVIASAPCADVERVRCVRVVDAGTRRLPLQRKVGASLTKSEFAREARTGRFGHIGLRESIALIGKGLGLELDEITQTLEPVIATERHRTSFLTIEPGQVAGIHNIGHGKRGGETVIELDLSMYVGAPEPRDEVVLFGSPDVHLRIEGGTPGDQATAAILVNTVPQAVAAEPGLKTVLDLPPPRLVR